jgi:hypothetical protein
LDTRDIASAGLTVTEDLSKGGDVKSQTALIDYQRPPSAGHQLTLTHDSRRSLDQHRENVQCSAADLERDAVFLENSLSWTQPKRSELNYTAKLGPRRIPLQWRSLEVGKHCRRQRHFWISHACADIR